MISIRRLEVAFPGKGKELHDLLTKKTRTTDYKSVQDWERQCYNRPTYQERLECALNEILEGCGTEAVFDGCKSWPEVTYINMGDTYNTTLLYDYYKGRWYLTTWGDYYETNRRLQRIL